LNNLELSFGFLFWLGWLLFHFFESKKLFFFYRCYFFFFSGFAWRIENLRHLIV